MEYRNDGILEYYSDRKLILLGNIGQFLILYKILLTQHAF